MKVFILCDDFVSICFLYDSRRKNNMGKSSRDKRDIYYRLAKEQGWLYRRVFLIEADDVRMESEKCL